MNPTAEGIRVAVVEVVVVVDGAFSDMVLNWIKILVLVLVLVLVKVLVKVS